MASGAGVQIKLDGKIKIEFNPNGVMALCKSPEMQQILGASAERIAAAANATTSPDNMDNPAFSSRVVVLDRTAIGSVSTANPHGFNAKERIIDNVQAGAV